MQKKVNEKGIKCMKALSVSCVWTIFMLLTISLLWYKWNLNDGQIAVGMIVLYVSSAFLGGFVIGKYNKVKKYIWGLGIGLTYYILLIIFTLIMNQGLADQNMVSTMVLCIGGGMLGGMIS